MESLLPPMKKRLQSSRCSRYRAVSWQVFAVGYPGTVYSSRFLTRTSVFDYFRERELRTAMAHDPGGLFAYRDSKHNVFFNLSGARFLDMGNSRINSAMEVTKRIVLDMRSVAEQNAFRLIVALIPTKERVYGRLLDRAGYFDKYPRLAGAAHQEDTARDLIANFLHQSNIETIDLLPELETGVDERDLYPLNNMHPNAVGYRVIAVTIDHYLNNPHRSTQLSPIVLGTRSRLLR